jgi:hypothetical protein
MDALEALALLRREMDNANSEEVPDGWRTAQQWADAWGLKRPHTSTLLSSGIASGRVAMREFKIPTTAGLRRIPHYRVKP